MFDFYSFFPLGNHILPLILIRHKVQQGQIGNPGAIGVQKDPRVIKETQDSLDQQDQ